MINNYSQIWYKLFLETQLYTEEEVAFVMRNLPNPPYQRILDVGCGPGRHALSLAKNGYAVVGIDVDETAVSTAHKNAVGGATFFRQDMRELENIPGTFDVVICLWQSFGYFDEATNRDILRQIGQKLNSKGRLILDIYHRRFFEVHQGVRRIEREGVEVATTNSLKGNRLTARLVYADGNPDDSFEWQLFTPEEIGSLASEFDLQCLLVCTEYDEHKPATSEKPRMQLVFERDF